MNEKKTADCPVCNGTGSYGQDQGDMCPSCNGTGLYLPNEKKTSEELLREIGHGVISKSVAIKSMQEYAAQETAALREENERLKEAVKEWISVKDRVPTISTEVLVSNGHEIWIGSYRWFSVSDGAWSVIGYGPFRSMSITHWCPLPEPPKPTKKLTGQI